MLLLQVCADSQVSTQLSASLCWFCVWFKRTLTMDWTQRFSSADLGGELWTRKGIWGPVAAARRQPKHPELLTSHWVSNTWEEHQHRPTSEVFHFLYKNRVHFPASFTHPSVRHWGSLRTRWAQQPQWRQPLMWAKEQTWHCDCYPLHQLKVCSTLNPVRGRSNLSLCWAKSCLGSARRPNCTLQWHSISATLSSKNQQH